MTLPFCGLDPTLKGEKIVQMGPDPKWLYDNRAVTHPFLECYLELNTETLEGKPFHLVEIENGVGIEGGYEFEYGVPILAKLEVNNEW